VAVFFAELVLHLIAPAGIFPQLSLVALSFSAVYLLSAFVPPVREEMMSLKNLSSELRLSSQTA
jgi:hypothetical protein